MSAQDIALELGFTDAELVRAQPRSITFTAIDDRDRPVAVRAELNPDRSLARAIVAVER